MSAAILVSVPLRAMRITAVAVAVLAETLALPVVARLSPANRRSARVSALHRRTARIVCAFLRIRVQVEGARPAGGPYLAVCNHLGYVDVLALSATFPVVFVAEAKLGSWPVLGALFRTLGTIFVARDRRRDAPQLVEQIRKKLVGGRWVLVFPEGTPTCGAELAPFRSPSFEAAVGTSHADVLPLRIDLLAVDGRPPVGDLREIACWRRDSRGRRTPLLPHLWRLVGTGGVDLRLRIGTPFAPEERDRKELARLAQDRVHALGGPVRGKC